MTVVLLATTSVGVPHFVQNFDPSGSWAPHLVQNMSALLGIL